MCTSPKLTVGMFFDGTIDTAFNVSDDRDTPATGPCTGTKLAMVRAGRVGARVNRRAGTKLTEGQSLCAVIARGRGTAIVDQRQRHAD